MVSSRVTCTVHIFAVCVAVRTVIERGVHHQNHDAVDSELFFGALVVYLAPDVVCSREQSIIAGCRRLVGFVSEWLKRRRTSSASPLFELQNFVGVPNCYGRYCFCIWSCGRNGVDFQCAQFSTESCGLKSVALAWYVAPFRFARQLRRTMIEKS